MDNDKKIIMNKIMYLIMETIMSVLLLIGTVILALESEVFCAILAGVGVLAGVAMVLIDIYTVNVLLDDMELDSIRDYINKK
ncbi:MAG TPA: hypothetical protein DCR12_04775 [Lachnospiraceae bacterium]|nr:hypothetical protein [Lachnospiraceae bacterium]